ncbi:hypothetical protein GW764_00485 [Candidatus Parcubacteria bacterium]|nr:hypothetical protein [Candidatus Parcubacteria bacterium]
MKKLLPQYSTLILLVLIVCSQTGCKTTGSSDLNQNKSSEVIASSDYDSESNMIEEKVEFLKEKAEMIVETAEDRTGLNEKEIKRIKDRLKEGWDIDILGFFKVNASSDGVVYEKKLFKEKNGSIKTGVDDDGDPFFTLAIAF